MKLDNKGKTRSARILVGEPWSDGILVSERKQKIEAIRILLFIFGVIMIGLTIYAARQEDAALLHEVMQSTKLGLAAILTWATGGVGELMAVGSRLWQGIRER